MKRIALAIVTLCCLTLNAAQAQSREQMNKHDRARYDQMNSEEVWSVGVGIVPVVPLSHPVSPAFGGGRVGYVGAFGFSIEGGYFVVDNMRLSAELNYGSATSTPMLMWNGVDGVADLAALNFTLGGHWHFGRWDVGGGLSFGRSTLRYQAPNVAEGGLPVDGLGLVEFTDRRPTIGLSYEGNYMLSPFMKVGAFVRPAVTTRGPRAAVVNYGIKATIYLPFVDAVVCR